MPIILPHEIIYKINPDGFFTYIDHSIDILGYNSDEIIGKHFRTIMQHQTAEMAQRSVVLPKLKLHAEKHNAPKLFDERRTGKRITRNLRMRLLPNNSSNGYYLDCDVTASGIYQYCRGKQEKFLGTVGIIRSVPQHKSNKAGALFIRNQNSGNVFPISDFYTIITNNGTVLYTSNSNNNNHGYLDSEIISTNHFELIHPDDTAKLKDIQTNENIEHNSLHRLEYRFRGKDDSWITLDNSAKIVYDHNNEVICTVIYSRNITEERMYTTQLKEYAIQLKKMEKRYCKIVENSPLMQFLFLSENGALIYVNNSFCKNLNIRREEISGSSLFDFVSIQHHEELKSKLYSAGISNQDMSCEVIIETPAGEKWHRLTSRPFLDEQGNISEYLGILEDISEWKKVETNIRKSLHEREILLKEVHHRVKNNMQIICSLLELQAVHVDDETTRNKIKESVNRIFSMSRVHEMLYQLDEVSRINLNDYTQSISSNLVQTYCISPYPLKLNLKIDNAIYINIENAIPLGLIFNELLTNALKYAFPEKPGEISIQAFNNEEDELTLLVSDNGVGMPEDTILESSGSFGLKLVRNLTRQLKGRIKIDRNQGTQFTIVIPGSIRK